MLLPVYVPTALLAFGQGLLVPTLPFYSSSLGAPAGLIGFIVAAAGIGTLIADVPAGAILGRMGRRPAMLMGAGLGLRDVQSGARAVGRTCGNGSGHIGRWPAFIIEQRRGLAGWLLGAGAHAGGHAEGGAEQDAVHGDSPCK
jgi:MFS family permease